MTSTSRAAATPSDWPPTTAGSAQSPKRSNDPSSAEPSPQEAPRARVASPPLHLSIPAIKVDTAVTSVGVTSGGALGVPSGDQQNEAAWFRDSPTPGQFGASVIVGHIDTIHGPSVFYNLGALHPGDTIVIRRKDHLRITFVVDGVRQYPDRTNLPIKELYGGDPAEADLRLVTCSNFDHSIGHYRGNLIIYAHAQHT
ncbi:class F sortase [Microlunatus endophyticus]|uniref:Class F sortase n=2 Tax=Microlunatus endophyticus TaxID=1716077 RepID=A0A917W7H8_9ACTN|nr:class F sortase [Microlunatus endophyticus]